MKKELILKSTIIGISTLILFYQWKNIEKFRVVINNDKGNGEEKILSIPLTKDQLYGIKKFIRTLEKEADELYTTISSITYLKGE